MGQNYVDDHRVIRYGPDGAGRDITHFCSEIEARDELNALSVELSFTVMQNPYDGYVQKLDIQPGDKLRVVNHDTETFAGVVIEKGLDGSVLAYDRGWYLNTSQIILQCTNAAADTVIRQACDKAGITVGTICALPTKITQIWMGETPADIISDVLATCTRATGKEYRYHVENGALQVGEMPTAAIKAYHKPADNLSSFDITWALGQVSGTDSMADLRNAVVIAAEDGGRVYIGAQAKNAESVKRYGFLQAVEDVSGGNTAELGQQVKNMLSLTDKITRTRSVDEIWGADEVKSGVVLDFNSPAFGISGRQRVTSVTHRYSGAGHTMALELQALDEPRAADTTDTVSVWGLPVLSDTSGNASGSGTAAAFVAVAEGEIGYRESPGNINKYGAWQGNNGVAWCVIFVCWCADKAGAPVPTGYAGVAAMADYFRAKGLYRSAASGYVPQPGDLMIQGAQHIGIVSSATRTSVTTVDGNYSNSVCRVTRSYAEISGFCTPFAA